LLFGWGGERGKLALLQAAARAFLLLFFAVCVVCILQITETRA
jgi:hypothetical protein